MAKELPKEMVARAAATFARNGDMVSAASEAGMTEYQMRKAMATDGFDEMVDRERGEAEAVDVELVDRRFDAVMRLMDASEDAVKTLVDLARHGRSERVRMNAAVNILKASQVFKDHVVVEQHKRGFEQFTDTQMVSMAERLGITVPRELTSGPSN